MTSRDSLVEYLTKQVRFYDILIKGMQEFLESGIFDEFEGKVINKKLTEKVREFDREKRASNVLFSQSSFIHDGSAESTARQVTFRFHCHLDFQPVYSYNMDKDVDFYIRFPNKRFSFEKLSSSINETVEQLGERRNKLQKELENVDTILSEYNEIYSKIKEFNSKYSYETRTDMKFDRIY